MEPMFLSQEEVRELTGAGTKAGQIRTLCQNGIRHTIKANGWPCVPRAAVLGQHHQPQESATWKPRKAG